jgi:sugar/nucleoside kinase (ribokinase family)
MDLLVVGGIGVDLNVSLYDDSWPLDMDADTIFVRGEELGPGHAGSGVALGAAALGLVTVAADAIGDDLFGDFLRAEFPRRGVELVTCSHPTGTRRSVNLVRSDGRRLSLHDPRHPYDWSPEPALWQPSLRQARWTHVVIVNWARHALRDAVEAGVPTSTDLQNWDGQSLHHRDFAYGADVVFLSATAIRDRVEPTVTDIFEQGRAHTVIVTQGSQGATLFQRGHTPVHVPPAHLPGLDIQDTNGAGDAFAAGFLAATLRGYAPVEAARQGAIAASFTSSFPGTNTRLMTADELAHFDKVDGCP